MCPTALQVIAAALDKLGPKAERITPVLITIDPERDTPAQLASYVKSFHPRLVGLTGTPAEIEAVTKAYRVYVKKVPDPKSTAGYTIDHSSIIYVMGPDGAYRTHFTHATSVDAMAERLGQAVARVEERTSCHCRLNANRVADVRGTAFTNRRISAVTCQ